jgi:hypothetical protein
MISDKRQISAAILACLSVLQVLYMEDINGSGWV